jgi:hypothetical protein
MLSRKTLCLLASACMSLASVLAALVPWLYLTEYGNGPRAIGMVAGVVGSAVSLFMALRGPQAIRRPVSIAIILLFLGPPLLSMAIGRVTHARFGLTIYGLIPVPLLDLRVGPSGFLWFRDKTRFLSLSEVEPYLDSGYDLILGIGWEGAVEVDDAIRALGRPTIHILRTPEALALFDNLRSEGKRPVLILHSTC